MANKKTKPSENEKLNERVAVMSEEVKDNQASNLLIYGLLVLVIIIYGFARMQLIEMPLERDEGSYAYIGQLLLDGKLPYKDFYEMKLPGLFYLYAILVLLTGKTATGLHLGSSIICLVSSWLVFNICKSLYNKESGLIAGLTFCSFSLAPNVFGFTAQAEHFVSFQVILSFYLITKNIDSNRWLWWLLAGIVFTNAIFTKQIAVVFAPTYLLLLAISLHKIYGKHELKKFVTPIMWSAVGSIILTAFWFGLMFVLGVWDDMMFWVFEFPKSYTSIVTWEQGKDTFYFIMKNLYFDYFLFWLLGVIGIILGMIKTETRLSSIFILVMFIVGIMAVFPGYYFHPHYWIYMDISIAIGAGFGFYNIWTFVTKKFSANASKVLTFVAVLILLVSDISQRKDYYFSPKHNALSKQIYGTNPFVECKEIAKQLKKRAKANDEMIVFGSEPQLNFYTNMPSPTRHFFMGFLTKGHKEEANWIAEVKKDVEGKMPRFLVHVVQPFSWAYSPGVKTELFDYGFQLAKQHYDLIGIADMKGNKPVYAWDNEVTNYPPIQNGDMRVYVFERKSAPTN